MYLCQHCILPFFPPICRSVLPRCGRGGGEPGQQGGERHRQGELHRLQAQVARGARWAERNSRWCGQQQGATIKKNNMLMLLSFSVLLQIKFCTWQICSFTFGYSVARSGDLPAKLGTFFESFGTFRTANGFIVRNVEFPSKFFYNTIED